MTNLNWKEWADTLEEMSLLRDALMAVLPSIEEIEALRTINGDLVAVLQKIIKRHDRTAEVGSSLIEDARAIVAKANREQKNVDA